MLAEGDISTYTPKEKRSEYVISEDIWYFGKEFIWKSTFPYILCTFLHN